MMRNRDVVNQEERVVLELEVDQSRDICGCPPCCPGKQPRIMRPEFYPQSVEGLVDKIEEMRGEMNEGFRSTGFPICFFLLTPCLCCIPLCCLFGLWKKMAQKLEEAIHKFNTFGKI